MVGARLWFRCAAVHDPITPVLVRPAVIGWDAKRRQIELLIERALRGEELLRRMKGWITVDPYAVIDIVGRYGRLRLRDNRELVVEMESEADFNDLKKSMADAFGDEVDVELAAGE